MQGNCGHRQQPKGQKMNEKMNKKMNLYINSSIYIGLFLPNDNMETARIAATKVLLESKLTDEKKPLS